jgi:hypothetical protein
MSEQPPDPNGNKPIDYASGTSRGKQPASWGRIILISFLILLGAGLLIFGICTLIVMTH